MAAMKIESTLPPHIRDYCASALRKISVQPDPKCRQNSLDSIFARLQTAIEKCRIVELQYRTPPEQTVSTTYLKPYHLLYDKNDWHVIGQSSAHRRIRSFRLRRVVAIEEVGKRYTDHKPLDIQEYVGRAWSMAKEGRLYHVRLRFSPQVAHDVAEVRWHDTQTEAFEPDGALVLCFRVDGLNEITWWILSYGDQVEVLAPAILRDRVRRIAKGIIAKADDT
jgi:proteasome accessory factor B